MLIAPPSLLTTHLLIGAARHMADDQCTKEEARRRKVLEAQKKWRTANPERRASYAREWRKKNPDKAAATARKSRQNNRASLAARMKRYREKNAERLKAADKARREREKGPIADRNRRWRQANKERVQARSRAKQLSAFGLTADQYDAMHAAQGGLCAVCSKPQPGKRRLAVDHCHRTGVVRGLLCTGCNSAIGRLGDSVTGLLRAVRYLKASAARKEIA